MIVVDASAICAIVLAEPERSDFLECLVLAEQRIISPVNCWEAMISVAKRNGDATADLVLRLIEAADIRIASIGSAETALAFEAWKLYGKGRHPAKLNLGDCFAYGLAKSRNLPLLFKGADFAMTDVRSAL